MSCHKNDTECICKGFLIRSYVKTQGSYLCCWDTLLASGREHFLIYPVVSDGLPCIHHTFVTYLDEVLSKYISSFVLYLFNIVLLSLLFFFPFNFYTIAFKLVCLFSYNSIVRIIDSQV